MGLQLSRRQFVGSTAALSLSAIIPRGLLAASSATQRFVVRADAEIGVVRPEFHSHFAEHLGSCVYGGLWVGKKSPIPNLEGYRMQAIEYLRNWAFPSCDGRADVMPTIITGATASVRLSSAPSE
jgi:alpha-N-arabinofuranosidase